MAEDPSTPLQFVEAEADGYCDPETGVCILPPIPAQRPEASPAPTANSTNPPPTPNS
jgi:hypothetical protein